MDTALVCIIKIKRTYVRLPRFSTWGLMSIDQVVTRQIHRGMVDGVNEVWLHHGIVCMLHRICCVDYIHLEDKKHIHTTKKATNSCQQTILDSSIMRGHKDASITQQHDLQVCVVNASLLRDVTDKWSVIPRPWSHCWCSDRWVQSRPVWISCQREPRCASSCNGQDAGPAHSWPWCSRLEIKRRAHVKK